MTNDTSRLLRSKVRGAPLPVMVPSSSEAFEAMQMSVDRFCLVASIEVLQEMMAEDVGALCGRTHGRDAGRTAYRWGTTVGEVSYHGGKVKVGLPSWRAVREDDLLRQWAHNLMMLTVSTGKYGRAVRLAEGDHGCAPGDGTSKSAVSRRFVALSRKKLWQWLSSDLSELDLLVIQIDDIRVT